jgi:DnaJ-class molecular chaperone
MEKKKADLDSTEVKLELVMCHTCDGRRQFLLGDGTTEWCETCGGSGSVAVVAADLGSADEDPGIGPPPDGPAGQTGG